MDAQIQLMLTQRELAQRWGRPESLIRLASASNLGPRHIQVDGAVKYPMEEVQKFERACLFFDPADVALKAIHCA